MDRTVAATAAAEQSGIPQQVGASRDTGATARDATVIQQHAAGAAEGPTEGRPTGEAASSQVVAGAIPRQPPGFLPRPALSAQLDRVGQGASVVQVVTGMRGVGKTELTAAYARAKLAEGWRLVAWVNAEDTGSLLAGLATVADALGLSGGGSGQSAVDAGQAVRHRLEADGERCLIVFDGADDPDLLQPFVPADGAARVLITSTRPSAANPGINVPVDVFGADEAVAFLTGRTRRVDPEGAAAVAADLAYLPLALTQAAGVIAGQYIGYRAYSDRLRAMSPGEYLIPEEEQPHPPGVAESVVLSVDAVQALDQTGLCAIMLAIMAVLSPAGVRRELLHATGQTGVLASGGRRVEAATIDGALDKLAERSMLNFSLDGQTVIMHRLVMRVVREALARSGQLTSVSRIVASVLEAHADALVRSQDRPAVRDIYGQVAALINNTAKLADGTDEDLAAALLRLRFRVLSQLIEPGDDTLTARNNLAHAYRDAGRIAEAIPLFEQTLADRERLFGPDHPDTMRSRNDLANAYRKTGQTARAIPLAEHILAARERLLGADHPTSLGSRNNLAVAYREAGRAAEAIPLLEQTLAVCQRLLGEEDPRTLAARNNLALARQEADRGD